MNQVLCKVIAVSAFALMASHASADQGDVAQRLGEAKFSLVDAVIKAEAVSGPAISAKFELDDSNALVYSVYTVPQGLNKLPEEVDLTELAGPATQVPMAVNVEIFSDKEHIARAAGQMTVMQMSKLSLREIIEHALSAQPGTAFDVQNPAVRNRRPVADVMILSEYGHVVTVTIDLISGKRI
jgi:hypothetical protein